MCELHQARQACLEEARHKEIKALKDEIRALQVLYVEPTCIQYCAHTIIHLHTSQLSKYNLEKKVEDQVRSMHTHVYVHIYVELSVCMCVCIYIFCVLC